MLHSFLWMAWISVAVAAPGPAPSSGGPDLLVFCAPGYPGTAEEAQPTLDTLAAGIAEAAGWEPGSLEAVYDRDGKAGLERLREPRASIAMVSLPFYVEHRRELVLEPLLEGVPVEAGDGKWSLAAARGRLNGPGDLEGWTVTGLPGYSPSLVTGVLLSGWGRIPSTTKIAFSSRALSSLRKASRGEKIAVLLDPAQVQALSSLPFGDKLEVVHRSAPLPVSLLCAVDGRLPGSRRKELVNTMLDLSRNPPGERLLSSIRMERFERIHPARLEEIVEAAD